MMRSKKQIGESKLSVDRESRYLQQNKFKSACRAFNLVSSTQYRSLGVGV